MHLFSPWQHLKRALCCSSGLTKTFNLLLSQSCQFGNLFAVKALCLHLPGSLVMSLLHSFCQSFFHPFCHSFFQSFCHPLFLGLLPCGIDGVGDVSIFCHCHSSLFSIVSGRKVRRNDSIGQIFCPFSGFCGSLFLRFNAIGTVMPSTAVWVRVVMELLRL